MSMEMLEAGKPERDYALERLIMLSDGVFAIAITLLALELHPPEHWDGAFESLVSEMARPFGAFVLSFTIIATYWVSHRRMFGRFVTADLGLTVLNLILLGLITLVPVGAILLAEGGPNSAGYGIYMALIASIGVATTAIWGYASFKPALFAEVPPMRARVVVAAVLLIPAVILPILALVASSRASPAALVLVVLLVAGIRGLRVWAGRTGVKQWMP
ncbi:MAG: TMEM175 family protein [Pseudomonadota bacterium]